MKDVDQVTGADLRPMKKPQQKVSTQDEYRSNPTKPENKQSNIIRELGLDINFEDDDKPRRAGIKRRSSPEMWEEKQLIASGVLDVRDYPSYDENYGLLNIEEEVEEDIDIERNEDEPMFLRGQTRQSVTHSPIKVVKNPDGTLSRAAMTQSALAKERRELREQQRNQLLDIPNDLNRPWEDPMPGQGERHIAQELRSITQTGYEIPEWKSGQKNARYGMKVTKQSIKEQREGLPIFKLRDEVSDIDSNTEIKEHKRVSLFASYSCSRPCETIKSL